MAQAYYLTSAIDTLVTGASARQFTSPFWVHVQIQPVLVDHSRGSCSIATPSGPTMESVSRAGFSLRN
jgi:hypothetical protein